jgi:CelD/BcsL family acetyltransferase involved in cellulose biosynthesis
MRPETAVPAAGPLTCEVTTPGELGSTERGRWTEIRNVSPALSSPFFTSEFTAIVGEARRDSRVGVLARDGATVGFFPFHAGARRAARPIGRKLADYQGVIVAPDLEWDAAELVRLCGLRSYSFDHLVRAQAQFERSFVAVESSPALDFEKLDRDRGDGAEPALLGPDEARLKRRRIERRFGFRFSLRESDPAAFQTFMRWKSEQYRRTGAFDVLSRPWVVEVLERIHTTQTDDFSGVFSCVYAGDTLVAGHLGLRSGPILHSWFPAFDTRFAKYSPGLVLFLEIAEAAQSHGVRLFDLGKGAEPYKLLFANSAIEVGVGAVESGRASALGGRAARGLWSLALRSPLYERVHRLRRRYELG